MAKFALLVELKAKPGKESEVEAFLMKESALASKEPGTLTWSAAKDEGNPGVYAIYDTYDDEAGRQAHLNGEAGQEFAAAVKAGELFAEAPKIYFLQVVAEK
jgi:quinol monooxygenase YgiN